MTDQDKAVLNLKKTNRVLNKQIDDMEKQTQEFWNKAKEEKKNKNDSKALSLMRRRKLHISYLDAARGKQIMIEETLQNIKSAKIDVGVKDALEAGQQVVEELREKATIEDFEDILERQKETQEQEDELRQMLEDAGIDDDEVMDDINELEAELFGKEIDKVKVPSDNLRESDEEVEDKVKTKSKAKKNRKGVAA
eukprot:CAMPEP_0205826894 /NCGR_PEP_ID=MMETSP0206-20130828/30192_1 /ASSEMBLY_ACC=CAM_ASM_000279 /TAXON_ID=36767 /ORGANISM="Euplotes focardii, Strain TN1" /LENGTH=194 /DNA_ID=CAMNT_0053127231 /DNA_START=58 /DNA_END=642 /DNA_ORIENTATION=-